MSMMIRVTLQAYIVRGNKLVQSNSGVMSKCCCGFEDSSFHKSRMVEIIGFGEKGVKMYLEQLELPQAKYQTIYQYLDTHPNIKQLCYLPLHLSMLVYIAVETADGDSLSYRHRNKAFLFLTI